MAVYDFRIAIVGCGAIVESFYLPALSILKFDMSNIILVDIKEKRLHELSKRFGINNISENYSEILDKIDIGLISTPHHLHYDISMDFLRNGKHVLCEKPLASTFKEAQTMVQTAKNNKSILTVNNTRRLFPAYRLIKKYVVSNKLGVLHTINYKEGGEFSWPTKSGFYFKKNKYPNGVVLDRGAHVLDLLCWWLDDEINIVSSKNDSFGGVDAFADIKLKNNSGFSGQVKLSWLNKLSNNYEIIGSKGRIYADIYEKNMFNFVSDGTIKTIRTKDKVKNFNELGVSLLTNFFKTIDKEEEIFINAESILKSIKLIEESYKLALRFEMPWYDNLEII